MTDLAEDLNLADEGTPGEQRPQLATGHSAVEYCPDCPDSFEGPFRFANAMTHRIRAHGFVKATAPKGTKRGRGRPKGSRNKPKPQQAGAAKPPNTPRNPAANAPPRRSAIELVTSAATGLGDWLVDNEVDIPVGRVLALEAPLLAEGFDEAVAGTMLDRPVQWAIRTEDKFDKIGAPAALLFGTLILERNPKLWPVLGPGLSWAVEEMLDDLVAAYTRKATRVKKKKEAVRKLADIDPTFAAIFNLDPTADPVNALIDAIFAPKPESGDEQTNP